MRGLGSPRKTREWSWHSSNGSASLPGELLLRLGEPLHLGEPLQLGVGEGWPTPRRTQEVFYFLTLVLPSCHLAILFLIFLFIFYKTL